MNNNTTSYRRDIDGLRAIAVLSVILFHIDFTWVPGGYTGVDIFFVISGYLITRNIGLDVAHKTFSLRWFYVRRIRRILPVFYVVTLVTILTGYILLLPDDLRSMLASVRRAVLFTANIYFSKDKGYFDISIHEKPLLHTWSLSIEEQYYFFWPLLLMFFYSVGHRLFKQHKALNQPIAAMLTFSCIVIGMFYAQSLLLANPGATKLYFVLQTRFCELMIGSLTALLPFYRNHVIQRMLAYAGSLLIALGLFKLTHNSIFPGYNALFPCLGAAFLIYAGQGSKEMQMMPLQLLSLRALTSIGLLSYSLYLWHWPILAYMRYIYGSYFLPGHWIIQAVILTFMLALLSYRYVESKMSTVKLRFRHAFIGVFLVPTISIFTLAYGLQQARPIVKLDPELASYGEDVCHGSVEKRCVRGDPNAAPSILMTGDSHAAMLNSFVDVVGRHEKWSANIVTASSCSPVFNSDVKLLPLEARKSCSTLKAFVAEHYRNYDAIFFASAWSGQLARDPDYLRLLEITFREIARETPLYVFSDPPRIPISPFRLLRFTQLGLHIERPTSQDYAQGNTAVKNIVQQIPNAHWIDLTPALAEFNDQGIYAEKPTYFDTHHLNVYGALKLGEAFINSGTRILYQ